jgi:hypothetical protein
MSRPSTKYLLAAGARPNFMKITPIYRAFRAGLKPRAG